MSARALCFTVVVALSVLVSKATRADTLGELCAGDAVNLERAMQLGDRLGGHLVSGHIDGTGAVDTIQPEGESSIFTFRIDPALMPTGGQKPESPPPAKAEDKNSRMRKPPSLPGGAAPLPGQEIPPPPPVPNPQPEKQGQLKAPAADVPCPWVLRVEIVKGRTLLAASTGKEIQFRVSCDRLDLAAPNGRIQAMGGSSNHVGQIFSLFIIAVAAAEAAIGLAIVIALMRSRDSINVDQVDLMKG